MYHPRSWVTAWFWVIACCGCSRETSFFNTSLFFCQHTAFICCACFCGTQTEIGFGLARDFSVICVWQIQNIVVVE